MAAPLSAAVLETALADARISSPTAHIDSEFPLDSVLASLAEGFPPGKPLAVLLSTGAMNPIHYGHVAVLDAARAAVEARGYHVLGGFLSPTHDAYVGPKCAHANVRHFPGAARVSLVDGMLRGSTWLRTARWEVAQAGFEDFPQVTRACARALKACAPLAEAGGATVRVRLRPPGSSNAARAGTPLPPPFHCPANPR